MVGVVLQIEEVVVQSSVYPVVEELDGSNVKKEHEDYTICSVDRNLLSIIKEHIHHIE